MDSASVTVLVASGDPDRREAVRVALSRPGALPGAPAGVHVAFASTGREALAHARRSSREGRRVAIAVLDQALPGSWSGLDTALRLSLQDPDVGFVIVAAGPAALEDEIARSALPSSRVAVLGTGPRGGRPGDGEPEDVGLFELRQLVRLLFASVREEPWDRRDDTRTGASSVRLAAGVSRSLRGPVLATTDLVRRVAGAAGSLRRLVDVYRRAFAEVAAEVAAARPGLDVELRRAEDAADSSELDLALPVWTASLRHETGRLLQIVRGLDDLARAATRPVPRAPGSTTVVRCRIEEAGPIVLDLLLTGTPARVVVQDGSGIDGRLDLLAGPGGEIHLHLHDPDGPFAASLRGRGLSRLLEAAATCEPLGRGAGLSDRSEPSEA